jgi:hypothetical protein
MCTSGLSALPTIWPFANGSGGVWRGWQLTWNGVCRVSGPCAQSGTGTLQHERMERLHKPFNPFRRRASMSATASEGLRYREIGKILGVGTSTVGEFLQRALRKLVKINPGK